MTMIRAAACDEEEGMFYEGLSGEILPDHVLMRLLTVPNVLITAHQAFLTSRALRDVARTTVETSRHWRTASPSWKARRSFEESHVA